MRHRIVLTIGIVSCFFLSELAFGQGVRRSLWVDPRQVDLADPEAIAKILEQPVQRVILTCFAGGETLATSPSRYFSPMPGYRDKADVLEQFLSRAQGKQIAVAAYLDCLHWKQPTTPADRDVLAKHPTLAERNPQREFGDAQEGKFASPFHPQVRDALKTLTRDLMTRYPKLDGVVLQCKLSPSQMLGYSKAARDASFRATGLDPLRFDLSSPRHKAAHAEWQTWRSTEVRTLIQELAECTRSKNEKARVSAIAQANYYRLPEEARQRLLADALAWAETGAVDEIIVDCPGDQTDNDRGYAHYRATAAKHARPTEVALLLPLREGEARPYPPARLQEMHGRGVTSIVVRVDAKEDVVVAQHFWQSTLPKVERLLPRPDLQKLETDQRLQAKLSKKFDGAGAADVLNELQKVTRLKLTASNVDNTQPVFASWSFDNLPAWQVMQNLALSGAVQGTWEPDGDGYRIVGSAPISEPDALIDPSHARNLFLIVGLLGFVVFGLNLSLKRWKKQPPVNP